MEIVKKQRTLYFLIFSFFACGCFNEYFSLEGIGFTNNVLALLFFAGTFSVQKVAFQKQALKRKWIYCGIGGLFFAITLSFGTTLESRSYIPYTSPMFLASNLVYSYLFACVLYILWDLAENIHFDVAMPSWLEYLYKKVWIKAALFLVCWLPAYIGAFPGNFTYDAQAEAGQITGGFSGDFPLIHSFLVTTALSFSQKITGSLVCGIAILTAAQALFLAWIFSYMVTTFYRNGVNGVLLLCSLAYIALSPGIAIFAVSLVRDVLFGALVTFCVVMLYQIVVEKHAFWNTNKPYLFGVVLALTLLSRNNSSAIAFLLILIAVCVVILVVVKTPKKKIIAMSVTALLTYCMIQGGLYILLRPGQPSDNTTFSLPVQQLAKVANSCTLDEAEKEKMDWVFPDGVEYCPGFSDASKTVVSMKTEDDWSVFWDIWKYFGKRYKNIYLTAFFESTVDFWYPNAVIDGYNPYVPSYADYDKCWFAFSAQDGRWGYQANEFNRICNSFYNTIGLYISFEKIPVLSMLFSIGFQFWFIVNDFLFLLYRKRYGLLLPIAVLLVYCVITALTPLILVRYTCAIFMTMPVVAVIFLGDPTKNAGEKIPGASQ